METPNSKTTKYGSVQPCFCAILYGMNAFLLEYALYLTIEEVEIRIIMFMLNT
jgi:hypothetical protein